MQVIKDTFTFMSSIAVAALIVVTVAAWLMGAVDLNKMLPGYSPHAEPKRPAVLRPADLIPPLNVPTTPPGE